MLMQDYGLEAYQQVDLQAQAASATPHQLVVMLIDGLLDELVRTRGHIQARRLSEKSQSISKGINILMGLDSALDLDNGGEIAENLHQLYQYAQLQLYQASIKNDVSQLDVVEVVLGNIREGWTSFGQYA